jgi:protein-S-isoprenylcysteine O-methyltransferase Ste14
MLAVGLTGWAFPDSFSGAWRPWVAGALFGAGAASGLAGMAVLGRNRTIFPYPNVGSQLVRHGVYRWIRHPLYTSVMTLSLGWAVARGSALTLVLAVALIVLLRLKAGREEHWLGEQFPEYADYARRVARFIPGVW